MKKKKVVIIGGGPSALLLAAHLHPEVFDVHIYEKNAACGRKFLVAGKGGFNLTHSEELDLLISRYTPNSFLEKALRDFSNTDLRSWLEDLGISTFVGSSKRVYPEKGKKPIEVLEAILEKLEGLKVKLHTNQTWQGWNDEGKLSFSDEQSVEAEFVIFSLGGASWKKTGSDGSWTSIFSEKGINILPFQASNCAYQVDWNKDFIERQEGKPLKNIAISCGNQTQKGELVLTKFGLEGGSIYALSPKIRKQFEEKGSAGVSIDLKVGLSEEEVLKRLQYTHSCSWTKHIVRELRLDKVQIALLKNLVNKEDFNNPKTLVKRVKSLPVTLIGSAPIDEAISTVGGIDLDEVDEHLQLKKISNHYSIGEMLDWDAPTGGYLLQACFSMGVHLAHHLNSQYS